MHVEWVRDLCLSFDDVEECQPFGPENLVYKIKGKMFLLISLDQIPTRINVNINKVPVNIGWIFELLFF